MCISHMSDDISMSHLWHQNMKAVPKPEMMMTIHLPLLYVFLYPAAFNHRTYKGSHLPTVVQGLLPLAIF